RRRWRRRHRGRARPYPLPFRSTEGRCPLSRAIWSNDGYEVSISYGRPTKVEHVRPPEGDVTTPDEFARFETLANNLVRVPKSALAQAPEVLHDVRVGVAANVLLGMVDDAMVVAVAEVFVRPECVSEHA